MRETCSPKDESLRKTTSRSVNLRSSCARDQATAEGFTSAIESRSEVQVLSGGNGREPSSGKRRLFEKDPSVPDDLPFHERRGEVQANQVDVALAHSRELGLQRQLVTQGDVRIGRQDRDVEVTLWSQRYADENDRTELEGMPCTLMGQACSEGAFSACAGAAPGMQG